MTATLEHASSEDVRLGQTGLDIGGLVRSEWTKIRSLRSSVAAFALLVGATIGFTALFVGLTVTQWDQLDAVQKVTYQLDPTRLILGAGFQISQLAVCVLGVLAIANEYTSGTIRASLLAVPRRTPMLMIKAAVFAVLVFVVGEAAAFAAFAVGAPNLHSKVPVGIGGHIYAYVPTSAGQLMVNARQGPKDLLAPWQGLRRHVPVDCGAHARRQLPPEASRRLNGDGSDS